MKKLRALSPVHIALFLPWVVAIVAANRPLRDNSFLWHVVAGSLQMETTRVLTSDPFSFTRLGEPWRTQSWLLELGYGYLDERLGLDFVPWFMAAVVILTLTAIGLIAFRVSRSPTTAAVVVIASIWTSAVFLSPRPVIVSYLLFAIVVIVARDGRLRWVLPLVFWIWASVHASFPVGIAYLALDGIRRRNWRASGDVLVSSGATLLTAHGFGLVEVLLGFLQHRDALDLLTEWGVPNLVSMPFLFIPVALLLLIAGGVRSKVGIRDLVVVGPMVVFLLTATRAVFPAWIGLVPFIAAAAHIDRRRLSAGSAPLNAVLLGLIAIVPFALGSGGGLDPERFPVGLRLPEASSRTFHDDVVGGYLVYSGRGKIPVFVDDRAEVFGAEIFSAVIDVKAGKPLWREVFEEWDIDTAVTRTSDTITSELEKEGWLREDETDSFVLLARP